MGIDGATWTVLSPLISKGELPHFHEIVTKGVSDTLMSTVPPLTAPSWTSMFTGVNPGKHGIVDFILREADGFVPSLSHYRMCKTIWQIVSEVGRRCVVINDPVTYPPEHVNGIMITGLMTPPGSANWIYPKELKHEIDEVAGGYECDIPPDIDWTMRENSLNILRDLTEKTYRVSKHVASDFDWDLLAVIFTMTDRLQHFWWNDSAAISEYYRKLDNILGDYLEYTKDHNADLIVVSDHGFGPCKTFFRISEWLRELDLAVYNESPLSRVLAKLKITKEGARDVWGLWPPFFRALPAFLQEVIRTYVPESGQLERQLDIGKSLAYARGWAGIFVAEKRIREYLTTKLSELTDRTTRSLIFEKVMKREDVLQGPYLYRAADLLLLPSLGYHVLTRESAYETAMSGTHRPEGIFVHYRPNSGLTHPASALGHIRPWDVGASILHTLGVPIPEYFDGKLKYPLP